MSTGLRIARLAVALLALAVVGISVAKVVSRSQGTKTAAVGTISSPTEEPSPSPSPSPPRVAFTFPAPKIFGITVVGGGGQALSVRPAQAIQEALSTYYDQAFMDPASWTAGVPDSAWEAFDDSVRSQAKKDVTSLALGSAIPDLASLEVTKAALTVHVLLNAKDQPEAAVANVTFKASGAAADGGQVTVTNNATFLFRLVGKDWLIFGYPETTTTAATAPAAAPPTTTPAPTVSTP